MKHRYLVATEHGYEPFRWWRQARRVFRAMSLSPGESVVLVRYGRDGRARCIDERYEPPTQTQQLEGEGR